MLCVEVAILQVVQVLLSPWSTLDIIMYVQNFNACPYQKLAELTDLILLRTKRTSVQSTSMAWAEFTVSTF